jgi:hypothetical protein
MYGTVWWIFRKPAITFTPYLTAVASATIFVELGAFELISAFATWEMMGSCLNLLFPCAKSQFLVENRIFPKPQFYGRSYGESLVILFSS